MQYLEFQNALKGFTVFSLADIRQAEPGFHRRRLNDWQAKGYIKKVVKGHYVFSSLELDEQVLFEIANRIYPPSYVSFEMALSFYGLIPESVFGITSASTRKTSRFSTTIGEFLYRTIQPRLYFGFVITRHAGRSFRIAEPEKAFLDLFYARSQLREAADFAGLRVNDEAFGKLMDRDKLTRYLAAFDRKSLRRRVDAFLEYITHA